MNATIKLEKKHFPVLLNELESIISPLYGGTFIDCTFGAGGYSKKILEFKNTKVIGLDRDIESQKIANTFLENFEDRFIFKNLKFSQLTNLKIKNENIKGVIFDLGYSLTQIKDPKKGLSFNSMTDLNMQLGLNDYLIFGILILKKHRQQLQYNQNFRYYYPRKSLFFHYIQYSEYRL